jgi:hypothetical protein
LLTVSMAHFNLNPHLCGGGRLPSMCDARNIPREGIKSISSQSWASRKLDTAKLQCSSLHRPGQYLFFFFLIFWVRVLSCNPGCPPICNPPVSVSQVLGLQHAPPHSALYLVFYSHFFIDPLLLSHNFVSLHKPKAHSCGS